MPADPRPIQGTSMNDIRARVLVGPDHHISGIAPASVPPGEHEAVITVPTASPGAPGLPPLTAGDLPSHDLGAWPEGLRLRREDLYGDEGR
jgi:hypothetical protein